jgi:hypothetical protein
MFGFGPRAVHGAERRRSSVGAFRLLDEDAVEARRQVDFVLLLPSRIRPPEKEASREPPKDDIFRLR